MLSMPAHALTNQLAAARAILLAEGYLYQVAQRGRRLDQSWQPRGAQNAVGPPRVSSTLTSGTEVGRQSTPDFCPSGGVPKSWTQLWTQGFFVALPGAVSEVAVERHHGPHDQSWQWMFSRFIESRRG